MTSMVHSSLSGPCNADHHGREEVSTGLVPILYVIPVDKLVQMFVIPLNLQLETTVRPS